MPPSYERAAYTILADDVAATAEFYTRLGPFRRKFSSHWYVVLVSEGAPVIELGIIDRRQSVVPMAAAGRPAAGYLRLVVDDIDGAFATAKALHADIISEPCQFAHGQTHLALRDPNGVVLDIAAPSSAVA